MATRTAIFGVLGAAAKVAARLGGRLDPRPFVDMMIRLADGGDRFGLRRGGLSFNGLTRDHPHGVVVAPHIRTGVLAEVVAYRGGRVRLEHADIADEISRLSRAPRRPGLSAAVDRHARTPLGELVDAQCPAADAR